MMGAYTPIPKRSSKELIRYVQYNDAENRVGNKAGKYAYSKMRQGMGPTGSVNQESSLVRSCAAPA